MALQWQQCGRVGNLGPAACPAGDASVLRHHGGSGGWIGLLAGRDKEGVTPGACRAPLATMQPQRAFVKTWLCPCLTS